MTAAVKNWVGLIESLSACGCIRTGFRNWAELHALIPEDLCLTDALVGGGRWS